MNSDWNENKLWVAHFDILGFKTMIGHKGQIASQILKDGLDEIIEGLEKDISTQNEHIDFQFYADTFIIYSKSGKINDYPSLITVAKSFIKNCIRVRLPVRGAISYGEVKFGHNNKIILGEAFLESYKYGEDQNWIGLILTPSASEQLINNDLNPIKHGFINQDIPMREFFIDKDKIYAYRFINGSTNFACPLLPFLKEMWQQAPQEVKEKYTNTINFIEKHYTVHLTQSAKN